MSNLTEQWKKGELKDGKYWVQLSFSGTIITAEYLEYNGVFELDDHYYEDEEISKVLAPVPSYDEWHAKLEENARLKHDVGNLGYKIKNQRKEIERQIAQNAKLKEEVSRESYKVSEAYCYVEELKELLKECHSFIEDYDNKKLLTKIDEVLK